MARLSDPTVVLIPGLNNTGSIWDDVRQRLNTSLTVAAPTLDAVPDVDVIADDVLAAYDGEVVAVGYSFGGYVALAMADRAPDRVVGLCLVASSPLADTESARAARRSTIDSLGTIGHEAIVDASHDLCVHPDHVGDETLRSRRSSIAGDYGADRLVAHLEACMARPDRATTLNDGSRSTLMIAGDDDRVIPTERQRDVAAAAGIDFVEIGEAGHLLVLEQPTEVADALSDWLTRITVRPPRPHNDQHLEVSHE